MLRASDFSITGFKKYTIFSTFKKGQKNVIIWPNHFISDNPFQKDQIWMIWPLRRPIGNHGIKIKCRKMQKS